MTEVKSCRPCRVCKVEKEASAFGRRANTKAGLDTSCLECCRERDKRRYKTDRKRRQSQAKWAAVKMNFGITKEQWFAVLEEQNRACAICSIEFVLEGLHLANPCIDHDHGTNAVRGMLCRRCNQGIGLLQDSSSVAKNASDYLRKHGK